MSKLEGCCVKFAITLGKLTAKLKKEKPFTYDIVVFDEQVKQYNKGFRLHRINKPNSSGTKMTFKAIETKEELKEVSDFLDAERERLQEIMKKNYTHDKKINFIAHRAINAQTDCTMCV